MRSLFSKIFFINVFSFVVISAQANSQWSYDGPNGPAHWGELDKSFAICDTGKTQSPINIQTTQTDKHAKIPLMFHYAMGSRSIINNGHTMQISGDASDSLSFNNHRYTLSQLHFHAPAENYLDGKTNPGEIHFVYGDGERKAVVAVFIARGPANPALAKIIVAAPRIALGKATISGLDLNQFIPTNSAYYSFTGSLTTPPCTESLQWFVMKEPITASDEQIAALETLLGHNARPIQNSNDRQIVEYQ